GAGAGQCPERARHRRARAIASLSRRHVPDDHRPAAPRRLVGPAATAQVLKGAIMRKLLIVVSLLALPLAAPAAHAHAFLDHASPLVGSSVASVPTEVVLTYTQNLEPAFSSVEVTGPGGARVDQGKASVSGNTMRVGIKSAGPGSYKVRWHVLSGDT